MPIEAGQQLLHYRLIEKIGEGGMGVVWKAVDTKLDREIAIKVIPDVFAEQPERMARFEREAKLLASLDHLNIATIHGLHEADGMRFLAMELVEGEDLSQRLSRGAMPLTEALEAAKQIADALAAAHSNGIVHRDLKPANVRITPQGKIKVLDFGLAKVWEASAAEGNLTHSPTLTAQMTQAGVILGTASYMSPEQARGHEVDKRTDVWAFGCVLLEMLSGQQVFSGDTVTDVIASVVAREPKWESLPGGTPRSVRRLLQRCLRKEAKQRLNDIADARLIIEEALETGGAEEMAEAAGAPARKRRERLWMAVATLFAVATTSLAILLWQSSSGTPQIVRAYITAPPGGSFYVDPVDPGPATLSPDGTKMAYSIREADGSIRLWVRDLDEVEARPLRGTEFAEYPFWSPDSRMIAFFTQSKLKKIEASGGPPVTLCDAPNGKGGTWNRDGVIVFTPAHNTPLSRVSSAGGDPTTITEIDREAGENSHRHPRFLPDGRHLIYLARQTAPSETGGHAVRLLDLDSGEDRELFRADSNVEYSRDHLFFLRDATLMARPFSVKRREPLGDPFPVAENLIFVAGAALGIFSLSEQGTLVYQTGDVQAMGTTLEWTDLAGGSAGRLAEKERHNAIDLSPDGRSVAASITDTQQGTDDLWIYNVERKIKSRFTFHPANDLTPAWSPDGSKLAFSSDRGGNFAVFIKPVEGGGEEQLLLEDDELALFPLDWTPDGNHLLLASIGTQWDIGAMAVNPPGEPFFIQSSSFNEQYPTVSPDGRWLAYASDETGRYEVYVTLFPDGGRKWQISENGGDFPRWGADRKNVYYLEPDGTLIVADLEIAGSTLNILETRELFVTGRRAATDLNYDVTADGERFLIAKAAPGQDLPPLTLVVNWKP